MARRYRYKYRRGYGRRRYKRYWKKYWRRYSRRFINGSSKSIVRVKVPVSNTFSIPNVPAGGTVMNIPITPFDASTNAFSALTSPLYQQYCKLYDEVKCIGCKCALSIGTPIGTSSVPSVQVITAWDRKCCFDDLADIPTFANLKNYGSQQTTVAVNNSIPKLVRSCYASDLMEKATWHDCSLAPGANSSVYDPVWGAPGNACTFFAPAMWLAVAQSNASAAQTISFQIEIKFYFAFRNPKYGASSSNKALAPMDEEEEAAATLDLMQHEDEVERLAPSAKRANVTFHS